MQRLQKQYEERKDFAELAAAVSNAGGLGTITGLTQGTPEKLA